ncbi:unnamed protein product [Brassica rapa]|uniref:DUF4283 domain-containing protein n=1 Tax=Brassica campestris TaxID=3711 RepID=A0A8D9DDE2_BRACM|nr:unnamed protein product [Brassica rapa]
MQSRWAKPGLPSAVKPLSPTSGDVLLPPPYPPYPLTHPHPFLPSHLSPPTTEVSVIQNRSLEIVDTTMVQSSPENCPIPTIPSQTEIGSQNTIPATGNPSQTSPRDSTLSLSTNLPDRRNLLPPSLNSPLLTNKALNPKTFTNLPPVIEILSSNTIIPPNPSIFPSPSNPPVSNPSPSAAAPLSPPTLADQLRVKGDKSLKRLAPLQLANNGRPRVIIPDSVFHKGAEMHKDFIVCYFNGRPPPFNQIQSVLSHMWRKGKKLEIHNNPRQRSAIVCIPSDYLRQKILEKNIWYVGDSMFHTAQWSSAHSASTPPLSSIQIWAHLTGVPLDLRYQ